MKLKFSINFQYKMEELELELQSLPAAAELIEQHKKQLREIVLAVLAPFPIPYWL